jgi:hypothetical protein
MKLSMPAAWGEVREYIPTRPVNIHARMHARTHVHARQNILSYTGSYSFRTIHSTSAKYCRNINLLFIINISATSLFRGEYYEQSESSKLDDSNSELWYSKPGLLPFVAYVGTVTASITAGLASWPTLPASNLGSGTDSLREILRGIARSSG